jgi:hypothetical protein
MDKIKRRKRGTMIHKTLEKQHELHYKTGMLLSQTAVGISTLRIMIAPLISSY